ncbi:MAG: CoA-binding protein [Planctomycetes bacterium]|nr:CoA-binding protein [Planctomycetota bacterium]MCW8135768.1 CoA-binding protein [Planctomycetota bacterium]
MDLACQILKSARRVAVLGMSPKPHRTSHAIAMYMQGAGYEIIPVNPGHDQIESLACYRNLQAVPGPVDIVDVFRAAEHEHEVAADVLAMNPLPKAVWFQLNAGGWEVEERLRQAGIAVFVDSCIKVVHGLCLGRL